MSGDVISRTAIWLVAVALWVSLNTPDDSTLLPKWAGLPTVLGGILILAGLGLYMVFLEEPATRKRFGAAYDDYCRRVPRWVPRRAIEEHRDPRDPRPVIRD